MLYVKDYYLKIYTYTLYRVNHKEWDCKDDVKFFKNYDSEVKLSLLPWI